MRKEDLIKLLSEMLRIEKTCCENIAKTKYIFATISLTAKCNILNEIIRMLKEEEYFSDLYQLYVGDETNEKKN